MPRGRAGGPEAGLRFDRGGGPVLALCGLAGGAGTTTMAYTIAERAATESGVPVLLCEAESVNGGLRALLGVDASESLGAIAARGGVTVDDGDVTVLPSGLRVLAARPAPPRNVLGRRLREPLAELLAGARARHGLVVLDCGTLHAFDARVMLGMATHIAWVVGADRDAAARGALLLESPLAAPPGARPELLLAVARERRPAVASGRMRALRALAETRCERLVCVPHGSARSAGGLRPSRVGLSLAGLATFLTATSAPT